MIGYVLSVSSRPFPDPPLTTPRQPGYKLGASAARLLFECIGGRKGPAQRITLATEQTLRASVGVPLA